MGQERLPDINPLEKAENPPRNFGEVIRGSLRFVFTKIRSGFTGGPPSESSQLPVTDVTNESRRYSAILGGSAAGTETIISAARNRISDGHQPSLSRESDTPFQSVNPLESSNKQNDIGTDEYLGNQEAYDSNRDDQPDTGYDSAEVYDGRGAYGETDTDSDDGDSDSGGDGDSDGDGGGDGDGGN